MKGYRKVEIESKIAIKKIRFSPVMKAFSSMMTNKKVYKKNSKNLSESNKI